MQPRSTLSTSTSTMYYAYVQEYVIPVPAVVLQLTYPHIVKGVERYSNFQRISVISRLVNCDPGR